LGRKVNSFSSSGLSGHSADPAPDGPDWNLSSEDRCRECYRTLMPAPVPAACSPAPATDKSPLTLVACLIARYTLEPPPSFSKTGPSASQKDSNESNKCPSPRGSMPSSAASAALASLPLTRPIAPVALDLRLALCKPFSTKGYRSGCRTRRWHALRSSGRPSSALGSSSSSLAASSVLLLGRTDDDAQASRCSPAARSPAYRGARRASSAGLAALTPLDVGAASTRARASRYSSDICVDLRSRTKTGANACLRILSRMCFEAGRACVCLDTAAALASSKAPMRPLCLCLLSASAYRAATSVRWDR